MKRVRVIALAGGISLSLSACADHVQLGTAWYIVPTSDEQSHDGAQPGCGADDDDMIVVALLNRGRDDLSIHEVRLNKSGGTQLFSAEGKKPRSLEPGELLVLNVPPGVKTDGAINPIVPVRLYVSTRERQQRPVRLEVRASMPSTLSAAWLPQKLKCAALP